MGRGRTTPAGLAARLMLARQAAGLSQTEVARRAGIDRSYYAHIESGRHGVGAKNLNAIAAALSLDARDLLDPGNHGEVPVVQNDTASEPSAVQWHLGKHKVVLSALLTPDGGVTVSLACRSCGRRGPLWTEQVSSVTDAIMLTVARADAVQAVARHVGRDEPGLAERLQKHALLIGLGGQSFILAFRDAEASGVRVD